MWTLSQPAATAASSGGYKVTASAETWSKVCTTQARGTEGFARAVADVTDGVITECPRHVQIVCRVLPSRTNVQTFITSDEPQACATWVYVVDVVESDRTIYCRGGMSMNAFMALRRIRGRRRIAISTLNISKFYNQLDMQRESSIPEPPAAYCSSQSSLSESFGMSLSRDGSAAAAAAAAGVPSFASSPLDDYGTRAPAALQHAIAYVTAHMPLDALLLQRFEQMKNAAAYTRRNDATAPHVIAATGGTFEQLNEIATIAALIDTEAPSATLIHAADVVAHWMICLLVLPLTSNFIRTWFIEQETRLVLLHLRLACTNASSPKDFRTLLAPCVARHNISYSSEFAYRMRVVDTLRAGISLSNTKPSTSGHVCVDALHIAAHLLPAYIQSNVDGIHTDSDDTQIVGDLIDEDTCAATYAGAGADAHFSTVNAQVHAAVAHIIEERQISHTSSQQDSFLPRINVDPSTLPDLYDINVWRVAAPLCQQRLYVKLRDTGHLKHGEIFGLSWYLRDLSYSADAVNTFFKKHMTEGAGRMSDKEFQSEHASVGRRRENPADWEDGVRKRPYTQGCAKQVSGDGLVTDIDAKDQALCIGCPFERLDDQHLRGALSKLGGTDPGDIEEIISRRNAIGARVGCAAHFSAVFGGPPSAGWIPPAPRVWTHQAIGALTPYLQD